MKFHYVPMKAATLIIVLGLFLSALPIQFVRAQTTSLTFTATADSYVNAPYPDRNFGANVALRVDQSPDTRSYLRFNLRNFNGMKVQSAKLRVYANFASTSRTGYEVHRLGTTTWSETGITYANSPRPGSLIKAAGTFAAQTWTEVDISPVVSGEGQLDLVLTLPDSSNAVSLAARESGSHAPKLVVTLVNATPTGTPTRASTAVPTSAPTGQPAGAPTTTLTSQPTGAPTTAPTSQPTGAPTTAPTSQPTSAPTTAPTAAPSSVSGGSPQTFIPARAAWVYLDNGSDQGTAWRGLSFNDSSWKVGLSNLGYGYGGEGTVVSFGTDSKHKYITTYFRIPFTVTNAATFTQLNVHLTRDDGAAAYLNGTEIVRSNMPSGTIGYRTLASSTSSTTENRSIDPRLLTNGTNVIAVEVHQVAGSSRDLIFNLTLDGVGAPQTQPTVAPTALPTAAPTVVPTAAATAIPTAVPTAVPTNLPTVAPTAVPTIAPTTPPPAPQGGREWFVTPGGSSSGNGTQSNPWNLQTALNHPSSVDAGDIIWVRAGRYSGSFKSHLKGISGKPIIVRAYPGERATLDGSGPILTIEDSNWVNFWGLEITNSANTRPSSSSPNPGHGILTSNSYSSSNIKFINLVVHDISGAGMAWWRTNTDSEVYGSLIYNNGVNQLDHGIYSQNETGTKRITNNVIFDNASHGIHIYSSGSGPLNNFILSGNTIFDNGAVGRNSSSGAFGNYVRDILVGGDVVAQNPIVTNNYTYFTATDGVSFNLGYSTGSTNARVTNNYFMMGKVTLGGTNSGLSYSGNTIYGALEGCSSSTHPNNTFLSGKPGGLKYFVTPNVYEPGRANLTIYNWAMASTVSLPASALSGVQIQSGDRYELHNALNYYGDVISGTYNGSSIDLPMTGRSVARAVGISATPPNTFPEFGVFILVNLGH